MRDASRKSARVRISTQRPEYEYMNMSSNLESTPRDLNTPISTRRQVAPKSLTPVLFNVSLIDEEIADVTVTSSQPILLPPSQPLFSPSQEESEQKELPKPQTETIPLNGETQTETLLSNGEQTISEFDSVVVGSTVNIESPNFVGQTQVSPKQTSYNTSNTKSEGTPCETDSITMGLTMDMESQKLTSQHFRSPNIESSQLLYPSVSQVMENYRTQQNTHDILAEVQRDLINTKIELQKAQRECKEAKEHIIGLNLESDLLKRKLDDLQKIHGSVQLKTETKKNTETIYFRGFRDPLSAFYPCKLVPSSGTGCGMTFSSAEHLYHYTKLIFHSQYDAAMRVKNAETAGRAKSISEQMLPIYDTDIKWNNQELNIMIEINKMKARQCLQFRQTLLETSTARLVHNMQNDEKWGMGRKGNGENLMGVALQQVRKWLSETGVVPECSPAEHQSQVRENNKTYQNHKDHNNFNLDVVRKNHETYQNRQMMSKTYQDNHGYRRRSHNNNRLRNNTKRNQNNDSTQYGYHGQQYHNNERKPYGHHGNHQVKSNLPQQKGRREDYLRPYQSGQYRQNDNLGFPWKQSSKRSTHSCNFCGEHNHGEQSCRHGRPIVCHTCGKSGHKSRFCVENESAPCSFCGEQNHNQMSCRHGQPILCYDCGNVGHKAKFCC